MRSPSAVSWTGTAASAMGPASAYSSYSIANPVSGSGAGAGAAQQSVTGTAAQSASMAGASMQGASMAGQQLQMPPQAASGALTMPHMDTQASADSLLPPPYRDTHRCLHVVRRIA